MTVTLPPAAPAVVPGKPGRLPTGDAAGEHGAGVADMFAALVAALTAQMQPVATTGGGGQPGGEPMPSPPGAIPDLIAGQVATTAAGDEAVPAALDGEGVPAPATAPTSKGATPAVPAPGDGEQAAPAVPAKGAQDAKAGSAPADPATPATPAEGGARAQRAVPAPPATPPPATATAAPVAPALAVAPSDNAEGDRTIPNIAATPATPATAASERAVPATPAQPAAPAAQPHVQVARIVRPLRLGADGAYELALDLTPAELGRVRIDVELRGATIHLNLRADNPATRDLLQSSLDQLRSELEAAGLHAGNLDVGGRGASGRNAPDTPAGPPVADQGTDETDAPAPIDLPAEDVDPSGLNVLA